MTAPRGGLLAGLLVLAGLVALVALDPWPGHGLRRAWFDLYQNLSPRLPRSTPAVIVAVDERSLARYGQWPWPRSLVAQLIDGILAHRPAAVGMDMLFSEPGRLSPARWAATRPDLPADLVARLKALESNDEVLARTLARGPVVLGLGGVPERGGRTGTAGPPVPLLERGEPVRERLIDFGSLVRNLELLEARASGHGLLNAAVDPDGVVRRIPLVARAGGEVVPGLVLEMLRVAGGGEVLELHGARDGLMGVGVAGMTIPSAPDGTFRVAFSPSVPGRYVSAVEVLRSTVAGERLRGRLVLVGVTGLGIVDHPATPVAARMPGVEVHAQAIENIWDGELLRRPGWAAAAEAAAVGAVGLLLLAAGMARGPVPLFVVMVSGIALMVVAGGYAYATARLLLDPATASLATLLLFLLILFAALSRAHRERARLRRELMLEKEQALRAAGELEAAERIQMGILPAVPPAGADPRFDLAVSLEPARTVGGDLYDFYKLDPDHLFFVVGDVAGKGVPASLFMAITKTLWKSTALRLGTGVDAIINAANREVARDNPEMMFVTAVSGILDLASGRLDFVIAGHDPPLVLAAGGGVRRLTGRGGPPLCALDDFPYPLERASLAPGDRLCLVTDGVTEARDAAGRLYGSARLERVLGEAAAGDTAEAVRRRLRADVAAFCGGVPAADDLTILVLGWHGAAVEAPVPGAGLTGPAATA